jgi:cytidine deaminase
MDDPRIAALIEAARDVREHAYAPYSRFRVGAAVLAGDRSFAGVNVENGSFPVSMCAERNAVAAMVAAGERVLDAIAIVTDAATPTPPCGGCRQVLWDFGPSALVVSATLDGKRAAWALEDLLPAPFERGAP